MKTKRKGKARVLVVDDHPLFREGATQLINRQADLVCCAEGDTAASALQAAARHKPDVILLDLRLGHEDGLELIKILKTRFLRLPVVIVSQFDESLYAERALRAGALGYVMKNEATDELLAAIRSALAGEPYLSRKMAALLLRRTVQPRAQPLRSGLENLSDRELQVFQLLDAGLTSRRIAGVLSLSIKTVETYREHLKDKLGLSNATELVRHATAWAEGRPSPPGPR